VSRPPNRLASNTSSTKGSFDISSQVALAYRPHCREVAFATFGAKPRSHPSSLHCRAHSRGRFLCASRAKSKGPLFRPGSCIERSVCVLGSSSRSAHTSRERATPSIILCNRRKRTSDYLSRGERRGPTCSNEHQRKQLHLLVLLPIQLTGLVGPARIAGATALGQSYRHQLYSTNGARWTAVTPRTAASSRALLLRLAR
jgi:hypothetical protein